MNDLLTWQLIDSAFPGGGFAHSGGLEAAWQQKAIENPDDLANLIIAGLNQAAHFSLPIVIATAGQPQAWMKLDEQYDALLNNHVANRASRLQGRTILAAAGCAFDRPALAQIREQLRIEKLPGHYAPLFGLIACELKLTPTRTAELFAFQLLRAWISAAVRLGMLGPLEGQSLQSSLLPQVSLAVKLGESIPPDQIAQIAPFWDMLHANHDRLYSRLFQS